MPQTAPAPRRTRATVHRFIDGAALASTFAFTFAIAVLPVLPYDPRTVYALLGVATVALVSLTAAVAVELFGKAGAR